MAEKKEDDEEGVLLYYKYANVPDLDELVQFYNSNCNLLGLRGRVRIATHGVNVTVGGALASLKKHIAEVQLNSLFEGTDFKLASCSFQSNDQIAKECGFTSLSIRVVKELVTFSSNPLLRSPVISNAGKHLSAVEFNTVLQSAGALLENCGSSQNNRILLLDARNVYETRIGRFRTPNVETLDPKIRQYSDLCTWIDSNSEQLQGTNVLMYCTGGIRCEMASAYIRSKGAGYENVFQLYGGIQRYLEQFPDGGFFKGKNFVFDHRISVGSTSADIVGSCLLCGSPFDDYSARCRCIYCRMLVLVCNDCQEKDCSTYVCELCQKQGQKEGGMPFQGPDKVTLHNHTSSLPQLPCEPGTKSPRKLRILCLHGFRQNASSFKGRTSSLSKKIKHLAELVFVDAPHELPFIYIPPPTESNFQNTPPPENCKKKFAWLVSQEHITSTPKTWEMSKKPFDPLQYKQQTDGYDVSLSYLKEVFASKGPFDGVLGFSQGAAMAAMICKERGKGNGIDFGFVVLCSGFGLGRVEKGSIDCPSLHVFGDGEDKDSKDRQIGREDSMELVGWFKESCVEIITHGSGHIIPTKSPYIDRVKSFLLQFL